MLAYPSNKKMVDNTDKEIFDCIELKFLDTQEERDYAGQRELKQILNNYDNWNKELIFMTKWQRKQLEKVLK